ncbi:MAG TPA: FecR family protein [Burkholderiales bacterium]|nr:FecR family protein [Burkholderiales bacterium]
MSTKPQYRFPGTRLSACAVAVAAAFPAVAFAVPAARVEFAVGNPVAVSASGQSRALTKGGDVQSGDTVNTNGGRVQLRFRDGAYVSLQPQSEFRIDDYRYDGKTDGSERGFFSLLKGGLRTITGLDGRTNKKNYQVSTTVATIGIRGTEYTIAYTNSITGSVGEGEINVCTGTGCVPFGSGQSFIVTDPNSRPQLTSQKTDLPPTQPGDPPGGVFQTANDPTKPNGYGGKSTFAAADQTTDTGLPQSLCDAIPTASQCSAPPPPPVLLTGTQNYLVALSNSVFLGTPTPFVNSVITGTPSTLDASGKLVSFTQGGLNTMTGGTYSQTGNNGILAWGTFTNGTITGGSYAGTMSPSGGLFYVAGLPNVTLPTTGSFTYSPLTLANSGGGATLTSASLTLALSGSPTASLSLGFNSVTGAPFTATGAGAVSGGTFSVTSLTIGANCFSCVGHADGFFTGANATHAGVSYIITGGPGGPIAGAIPFAR